MRKCKICGNLVKTIVNFGKMPLANGFVRDIPKDEFKFPLIVGFCPVCYMVQLEETVKPDQMFNENYAFISSTSNAMAKHFEEYANHIMRDIIKGKKNPFVVELGSNDGIMLKHIAKNNIMHLGVEPSHNVAELARANGVNTIEAFFNKETAEIILNKYGKADVICGANVMCHIENINSVYEGVNVLLKDDGVLFFEDPYIYDIVLKNSFDQIYDEHIFYFSGLSISQLAKRHGMQLIDMKHQEVHGGSMRYYIKKGFVNKQSKEVDNYIEKEKKLNMDKYEGYVKFKDNVKNVCKDLKNLLVKIKKEGNRIVGYGATSKSTTLLNYAKIGPDLIDYICDITPTKINKYTPGTYIPIKSYEHFVKDNVSYVLLLAWNHKEEILKKETRFRERGGKFITFFPKVIVE
jgi:methylation protein EvaC